MRLVDGPRHSVFRLMVCMALWLGVVSVASSGINVTPTSARYTGATATGVRTAVTLEASLTGVANGVRNYAVPVSVSSSTLGSLARGALKRGLGWYGVALTIKDLINGAGWVIDELKSQVVAPATGESKPSGTLMYCYGSGSTAQCTTTQPGAMAIAQEKTSRQCTKVLQDSNFMRVYCYQSGPGSAEDVYVLGATYVKSPTFDWGSGTQQDTPIPDTQLGDLLKSSPQVINAILIDPETGAPIRTQEITDAMNALRKQLEAANGVEAGPDATAATDTSATQPLESEWPTFCGWATKVCDFIDWVRSDGEAEKELPEQEIDIDPNSWTSGISGGSCPAAETFALNVVGSQAQGEFSWQPLCDFSTMMRPFLIVVASVVAVLILAGLRSSTPK